MGGGRDSGERERKRRKHRREGEGEADSPLSREPSAEAWFQGPKIMTWVESKCLTDWATRLPYFLFLKKKLGALLQFISGSKVFWTKILDSWFPVTQVCFLRVASPQILWRTSPTSCECEWEPTGQITTWPYLTELLNCALPQIKTKSLKTKTHQKNTKNKNSMLYDFSHLSNPSGTSQPTFESTWCLQITNANIWLFM